MTKVAIITGAGRGIGQAIAERLSRDAVLIVGTATSETSLAETRARVEAQGCRFAGVATKDNDVSRVVDAALNGGGRIDLVVNNAGTTKTASFLELSDADWREGFEVKMLTAARLCRLAWPHLAASSGAIVNIAGVGGWAPTADFTLGGAVNAAVMSFTKALAQQGIIDGIRVNAVNPGPTRTERLIGHIAAMAAETGCSSAEAEQRLLTRHRVARFTPPEEIAELVAYVASSSAAALQGTIIDADSGYNKGI